jgi:hypothetical protein
MTGLPSLSPDAVNGGARYSCGGLRSYALMLAAGGSLSFQCSRGVDAQAYTLVSYSCAFHHCALLGATQV